MADQESKTSGENFFQFLKKNKWEIFAYVVLIIGLLLTIYEPFIGGLLVGAILGIYFSEKTKDALSGFKDFLSHEGIFRGFILVAGAIALFIASPGLCIGTLIGAFVRPYLHAK
jgi:hypothetical protein